MAILMLQEQGRLNLQDHVCQYVADCPAAWREIALYHLLTNSSGIPDFFVPCFSDPQGVEDAIAGVKGQPLQFQPGEKYGYSNVGYYLPGSTLVPHRIQLLDLQPDDELRASAGRYPAT
jgi:CubicO group peptidase (beta-lactamase class C family)